MAEILENIETIKFDPKDKKIKNFIDFAYFSGGIIGAGGPFVKWKEFLKFLFNSNQDIPYDKHLFDLIRKIDYELWQKWDIAFSYHEEMLIGLISKEEFEEKLNKIEEEIFQKYGDRLIKIEIDGIDKIYCLKPIPRKKIKLKSKIK